MAWPEDIDRVLLSRDQIEEKVSALAQVLRSEYAEKNPVLLGILTGSVVFLADLMRHLDFDLSIDFIAVSSYENAAASSGQIRILKDCSHDISGRHVLIVEDIIDTGLTLAHISGLLQDRRPSSVKICCLLDKPSRRVLDLRPDYVGFEIPDEFVVGYGLDFAEKYRQLPYIGVLKKEAYEQ